MTGTLSESGLGTCIVNRLRGELGFTAKTERASVPRTLAGGRSRVGARHGATWDDKVLSGPHPAFHSCVHLQAEVERAIPPGPAELTTPLTPPVSTPGLPCRGHFFGGFHFLIWQVRGRGLYKIVCKAFSSYETLKKSMTSSLQNGY